MALGWNPEILVCWGWVIPRQLHPRPFQKDFVFVLEKSSHGNGGDEDEMIVVWSSVVENKRRNSIFWANPVVK